MHYAQMNLVRFYKIIAFTRDALLLLIFLWTIFVHKHAPIQYYNMAFKVDRTYSYQENNFAMKLFKSGLSSWLYGELFFSQLETSIMQCILSYAMHEFLKA